jgi:hypothetical protein
VPFAVWKVKAPIPAITPPAHMPTNIKRMSFALGFWSNFASFMDVSVRSNILFQTLEIDWMDRCQMHSAAQDLSV